MAEPKATGSPAAFRISVDPTAIVFPIRITEPRAVITPSVTGFSRLTLYSTVVIREVSGRTDRSAVATDMSTSVPSTPPWSVPPEFFSACRTRHRITLAPPLHEISFIPIIFTNGNRFTRSLTSSSSNVFIFALRYSYSEGTARERTFVPGVGRPPPPAATPPDLTVASLPRVMASECPHPLS